MKHLILLYYQDRKSTNQKAWIIHVSANGSIRTLKMHCISITIQIKKDRHSKTEKSQHCTNHICLSFSQKWQRQLLLQWRPPLLSCSTASLPSGQRPSSAPCPNVQPFQPLPSRYSKVQSFYHCIYPPNPIHILLKMHILVSWKYVLMEITDQYQFFFPLIKLLFLNQSNLMIFLGWCHCKQSVGGLPSSLWEPLRRRRALLIPMNCSMTSKKR